MKLFSALAGMAFAAALLQGAPAANATTYSFDFEATGISATGTLDVTGTNATAGSGIVTNNSLLGGPETISLVTLATPGVHDLGGGNLSYRFGGGTDLIGDTLFPISSHGLVFLVSGPNDVGFNIWFSGGNVYAGFLAGDNGIYNEFDGGSFTAEATGNEAGLGTTPLPAGLPLFASGLGVLGLLTQRRKRKLAVA
jgi:hypothetical protein